MPDTQITHTIGRRKEAVCRVYLKPGSGKWDINGRTLGDYFPRPALVTSIQQPFTATDRLGQYDVKANVNGGGPRRPARGRPLPGAPRPRENGEGDPAQLPHPAPPPRRPRGGGGEKPGRP